MGVLAKACGIPNRYRAERALTFFFTFFGGREGGILELELEGSQGSSDQAAR